MNVNDIKNFQNSIAKLIREGSLHDAFAAMRSFSEGNMTWEITTTIDRLEQNYAYMLRYMAQGVEDAGRHTIHQNITAEARSIADILVRRALMVENPTLYYNTARTLSTRPTESISNLAEQFKTEIVRLSGDFESIADPTRTRQAEQIARNIFNRLWATHPLSTEDIASAKGLILSSNMPEYIRSLSVSGLALGAMEFYDTRRLELLLQIYIDAENEEVALRSLVSFFMAMFRYRRRAIPRTLDETLAVAKEQPTWQSDLKSATIEFMRTRDTERISDKLHNDILPTLSKIAPEMKDKFKDGEIDVGQLMDGVNPDWEDILNRDGLGDKLREMSEIQADGGDIYMSSFSSLKQFPFFNDVANWFLPFNPNHSVVASADNYEGSLSNMLEKLPFMCDSDKYSVMLSLASAPATQRDAVAKAMGVEHSQFHDMLSEVEKATAATRRNNIINNYVRDLYRFHKLFRRKGEFFNVFSHGINLLEINTLSIDFTDTETLNIIAEFCIKHGFWDEACSLLKKVDVMTEPSSSRAQKIAYCLDRMGEYSEAVSYYEEAELLGGAGSWLMERMARVFRRLGKYQRAIDCYKRILEITPDNVASIVELGNTYLDSRNFIEAEQTYHKAIYLAPDNMTARRGLAWSQFLNRKFDAADAAYSKLLTSDYITSEDYLNAAHTARARGEMSRAIELYGKYVATEGNGVEDLLQALVSDNRWLVDVGIDISQNKLIAEALLYTSDSTKTL